MRRSRSRPSCRPLRCGLVGLVALSLAGCTIFAPQKKKETPQALILHTRLLRFSQLYAATISAAADQVADATEDRFVREATLRWKMGSIPLMHRVVSHEDPRCALVDAWMVCLRQRINFEEGSLKDVFGDEQATALATAKEMEARIGAIARSELPPDAVDQAQADLEAFARGHPLEGKFQDQLMRAADRISAQSHPGVFRLLSIPIGGLDETAQSIERVAAVGEAFTEVVSEMPQQLRWETQLFLLESTRTGPLGDALRDLGTLSVAMDSFAHSVRDLPERMRAELETLLTSTDDTLATARELVTEIRAMLADLEGPLESTRKTSAELNLAGGAWTSAGTAVDAAMTRISSMGDSSPDAEPAPAGSDDSFKISDLTDAGTSLHGAAVEIRGLLGDLEFPKTDATVETPLDAATRRLEELVDTITLRAILLVGVLLAGLLLIRRYGGPRPV